ncbi:hypothetical protein LJ739_10945 [Aestuariibacter halophilus]|uniref:DUF624 domain-containing protein n=1 Tax=Fluctibacter halophilus TaxID=226011 RepID=A0ABS8G8H3_9ALTE|nr:hypothetical protein [Aestuariibacter halophilus]MCC2616759.1 hypothetical protein [Aestuariibacter halophilus]
MTISTPFVPTKATLDDSANWLKKGWQLFTNAPFSLFGLLMTLLIIEGGLQLLPAPMGVLLSKLMMAGLMASLWPLLHNLSTNGRLSFASLRQYSGWHRIPLLCLPLLLPFIVQLAVAASLLGRDGLDLLLFAVPVDIAAYQLAMIFAAGAPVSLLLMFAPARILLANDSVGTALRASVSAVLRAWRPLSVVLLINVIVLALVPYTFLLSALLLSPWLMCVHYQAYRGIFSNQKETR